MRRSVTSLFGHAVAPRALAQLAVGLLAATLLAGTGCRGSVKTARSMLPSKQVEPAAVGLRSDEEYRAPRTASGLAKSGGSFPVRQVGHTSGNC